MSDFVNEGEGENQMNAGVLSWRAVLVESGLVELCVDEMTLSQPLMPLLAGCGSVSAYAS